MASLSTGVPESKATLTSTSPSPHVVIHLFPCGHGDTILINVEPNIWILVDCHLPFSDGTKKRFFEFVAENEIRRLELVFQTHPDHDHYHGMVDVLHYFTTEGRSIGRYIDTGLTAQYVESLRGRSFGYQGYKNLLETVQAYDADGRLKWCELDAERPTISIRSSWGTASFVPIGPDPSVRREIMIDGIKRRNLNSRSYLEANRLSIVLALEVQTDSSRVCLLLTADTDDVGIGRSLEIWRKRSLERHVEFGFDVIKAPHHGSIHSHSSELPRALRRDRKRIAALSAGTRDGLPDRMVLQDYLQWGWDVISTTVRRPGLAVIGVQRNSSRVNKSSALGLLNRDCVVCEHNHVMITWRCSDPVRGGPQDAFITQDDLHLYRTTRDQLT
jgi:beta-lactamase superfamily II metal-dependent hydrolase